jgi:hypothetical protein
MQALAKEETCIIGAYGQLGLLSRTIKTQLVALIVSLGLNLCQCGAPSSNLQEPWKEITMTMVLPHTNVITANLGLSRITKRRTLMRV